MTAPISDTRSVSEHLAELRTRLLWVTVFFLVGSLLGYSVANPLVQVLLAPLQHQPVFATSPMGAFNVIMTVSLMAGLVVSLPLGVYHLVAFLTPAMSYNLRRYAPKLLLMSLTLLVAGVVFAYFLAVPVSLKFFAQFSSDQVKSLITADSYLSFVTRYIVGFGLIFQLPLLVALVHMLHPFEIHSLFKLQRFVLVGALIFGAVLSPEPFTMLLLAAPVVGLYYLSIPTIVIINGHKHSPRPVNGSLGSSRHISIGVHVFDFGTTVIVSFLFGLAAFFLYATLQNFSMQKTLVRTSPIPQDTYPIKQMQEFQDNWTREQHEKLRYIQQKVITEASRLIEDITPKGK